MDQLNQDSLNRERDTSLETDLRESETEREWDEEDKRGEERMDTWSIETQLRHMSQKALADFVDDLDPMVKGKLWAALENNRHD